MQRLPDHVAYGWIESSLLSMDSAPAGVTVAHCLPPTFERYLKLLHPIYEDLSVTDRDLTWDDVDRAEWEDRRQAMTDEARRIDGIIRQAGGVVRQRSLAAPFPGRRVFWRDLAARWGRRYHPGMTDRGLVPSMTSWPRYLIGPAEGRLDEDHLRTLVAALEPSTGRQDCFFWWMSIFRDEPMWQGGLQELPKAAEAQADARSPNYVWPSDRSWCLCTDYDLCFSLIGASAKIADALLGQPELELLEVTPSSRVDYRADEHQSP